MLQRSNKGQEGKQSYLLPVRNRLSPERAAFDPVREAAYMGDEPDDTVQSRLGVVRALQRFQRARRLAGQLQGRLQIGPDRVRLAARQAFSQNLMPLAVTRSPALPRSPGVSRAILFRIV